MLHIIIACADWDRRPKRLKSYAENNPHVDFTVSDEPAQCFCLAVCTGYSDNKRLFCLDDNWECLLISLLEQLHWPTRDKYNIHLKEDHLTSIESQWQSDASWSEHIATVHSLFIRWLDSLQLNLFRGFLTHTCITVTINEQSGR